MIYKIKFIDSARFIMSSLTNLVDNIAEGIQKKNVKSKDCGCFLEYESVNNNLRKYNCLSCNKSYSNKIGEELQKQFKNTFKFSNNIFNNYINKFTLLLRTVYHYEYMDE